MAINCILYHVVAEESKLKKILPKRGNLSKALSVDASDARHKILKLKKTKSVDARSRTASLSVVSESSESTGVCYSFIQFSFL